MFANNALLGVGVRVWIREQRKIKRSNAFDGNLGHHWRTVLQQRSSRRTRSESTHHQPDINYDELYILTHVSMVLRTLCSNTHTEGSDPTLNVRGSYYKDIMWQPLFPQHTLKQDYNSPYLGPTTYSLNKLQRLKWRVLAIRWKWLEIGGETSSEG